MSASTLSWGWIPAVPARPGALVAMAAGAAANALDELGATAGRKYGVAVTGLVMTVPALMAVTRPVLVLMVASTPALPAVTAPLGMVNPPVDPKKGLGLLTKIWPLVIVALKLMM
jgi:hypothetical protein